MRSILQQVSLAIAREHMLPPTTCQFPVDHELLSDLIHSAHDVLPSLSPFASAKTLAISQHPGCYSQTGQAKMILIRECVGVEPQLEVANDHQEYVLSTAMRGNHTSSRQRLGSSANRSQAWDAALGPQILTQAAAPSSFGSRSHSRSSSFIRVPASESTPPLNDGWMSPMTGAPQWTYVRQTSGTSSEQPPLQRTSPSPSSSALALAALASPEGISTEELYALIWTCSLCTRTTISDNREPHMAHKCKGRPQSPTPIASGSGSFDEPPKVECSECGNIMGPVERANHDDDLMNLCYPFRRR